MKKRLRKKFHVGEYQELGFEITLQFIDGLSEEKFEAFVYDFAENVLEGNNLDFEGGGDTSEFFGFIVLASKGSVTKEQKEKVEAWLNENSDVANHKVGELVDAWYM